MTFVSFPIKVMNSKAAGPSKRNLWGEQVMAQANLSARRNSVTQAIAEIAEFMGERLTTSQSVRDQHGDDLTWNKGAPPDAVAFAETTDECVKIVKVCDKYEVPVIAFGTGTSLEGHFAAVQGGISVDMQAMDQILEVNPEDLDCRVQAGVTREQLNEHLRATGLFFPIDPGANASLGGMAATRASGTNAVRYGTMRENVLALTAVMANGEVVRTSRRAKKSSAGYDLTRLLVGSEGTLGLITEVSLKLQGIPESIISGVCPFPDIESACNATIQTIQTGIPIARIELLDEIQVLAANRYSQLGLPEQPHLFVEFHGTEASAAEQVELFGEITKDWGGGDFQWATKAEDRNKLWKARHDAFWAASDLRPGEKSFSTDVCVPISRVAECVMETKRDLDESGLYGPIVGHVGDGNFHVLVFADPTDPAQLEVSNGFLERLVLRALSMDGTCTGEHGVGVGKMKYLEIEHGTGLDVMRQIKRAMDPKNVMNPGKIFTL
jgi:D-lactate dehydrogenase (cytochrome)